MTDRAQVNTDGGQGYQAGIMNVFNEAIPRNTSIIAEVVNILSKFPVADILPLQSEVLPARVQTKLAYNHVKHCRYIIETYKPNIKDLSNVYHTLEEAKPGRKNKVLLTVHESYKRQLGLITVDNKSLIESIQENADSILQNIIDDLRKRVLESSNLNAENEDVDRAIRIIVADAFIECLVLENPKALV